MFVRDDGSEPETVRLRPSQQVLFALARCDAAECPLFALADIRSDSLDVRF